MKFSEQIQVIWERVKSKHGQDVLTNSLFKALISAIEYLEDKERAKL